MNEKSNGILLESGTNEVEFLLFGLDRQLYGINVSKVRHIMLLDRSAIATVPKQPPSVLGVMKFRGHTISVIDLRQYLQVPLPESDTARELLLVTEFNNRTTAFVVDSVQYIERINWNEFEPLSETSCDKTEASVVGTISIKKGIVVILDLETIMSRIDPSMSVEHYESQIPARTIEREKVSIVYCEDSLIIQKLLVKTLEKAGFKNFHIFSTGEDGLRFLETAPVGSIDVILSDIEMPKMDGLTLCRKVRESAIHPGVPFVFFSSMIDEQMAKKCKSVGADGYYSKPQINEIVASIEKLVAAKRN